jgi:hypothetical protein
MRRRVSKIVAIAALVAGCSTGDGATAGSAISTEPAATTTPSTTTTATSTPALPGSCTTTTTDPAQGPVVAEPAVRLELLEMMRQDQEERTGSCLPPGTRLGPTQDYSRSRRLRDIVDRIGWPTFDQVGRDGAEAAWLIAQHADSDVAFQEAALALMTDAVAAGQADPGDLAYLTDRVAMNRGEPQTYGSQVRCRGGAPAPATPIVEPDRVDERRAAVGLGPLAAYDDELGLMCSDPDAEGSEAGS